MPSLTLKNKQILPLFGSIMLVIFLGIFSAFLFGDKLYLFSDIGSDTLYNYYPIYHLIIEYFESGHFPFWSFRVGSGVSILIFYQYLYDPFSIILYFVGTQRLAAALIWVYLLKICCAGIFSYIYLRELKLQQYPSLLGAVCFAFNGFLLGFGQHYFYASWVIFFPLLLYAIEVSINARRRLPIIVCTALLVLNIAIFWQMAVFGSMYLMFRLSSAAQLPKGSTRWYIVLRVALSALLGLGLAAALWLPEYQILRASPRISGNALDRLPATVLLFFELNPSAYYWSLVSRLFSNNLQGIGSEYRGYLNYYESLQLYGGLLWLLVIPQFLTVFSRRGKILAVLALLLCAALLSSRGFAVLMNGFQYPSFRWGYGLILFEILLGVLVLEAMLRKKKVHLPLLLGTLALLALTLYILNLHDSALTAAPTLWPTGAYWRIQLYLLAYALLLTLLVRSGGKPLWFFILLGLLASEFIQEHHPSFSQRSVITKDFEANKEIPYFDDSLAAIQTLAEPPGSLYRIEKEHWVLSLNDSMVQGYNALDSYNSLNHPSFVEFFNYFKNTRHHNVLQWKGQEQDYLSDILSVKYLLSKKRLPESTKLLPINSKGDVHIYRRRGFLPFGFTYDKYMLDSDWRRLPSEDQARSMLHAPIVKAPWSSRAKRISMLDRADLDSHARSARLADVLAISEFSEDRFVGTLNLNEEKLLFLSIPYDLGWTATVNGQVRRLQKVNFGFSGLVLHPGRNLIELTYAPIGLTQGLVISLLSLVVLIALLWYERACRQRNVRITPDILPT